MAFQQERPEGLRKPRDALEEGTGRPCDGYPMAEPETSMSMPSVSRTVLAPYKCPVPGYSGPLGCRGTLGMKRKTQDLYYSYRPSHFHEGDGVNDDDGEDNAEAPSKRHCCGEPSDVTTVAGGFSAAGASAFRLEFEDGDGDEYAAASPMAATATSIRRLAPVTVVPPPSRSRGAQVIPQLRRCSKIVRTAEPDLAAADTAHEKEVLIERIPDSGGHDVSKQSIAAKVAAASLASVTAALITPTAGPQAMAETLPAPLSPLAELPLLGMLTVPQAPVVMGSPTLKAEEPIMATGLREMEDFLSTLMRAAPPLQTPTVPTEPVILDGNLNVLRSPPTPLDISNNTTTPGVIAEALSPCNSMSAGGPTELVAVPVSSQLPATGDCTHTPPRAKLLTKGQVLPGGAISNNPSTVKYTVTSVAQTADMVAWNPPISPRPGRRSLGESALQLGQAESVLPLVIPSHHGDGGSYSCQLGARDGLPDGGSQGPSGVINGFIESTEEPPSTNTLSLSLAMDFNRTVVVPDGGPGRFCADGSFAPSKSPHGQCTPPAFAHPTASPDATAITAVAHVTDETEGVLLRPTAGVDVYDAAAKCGHGSTEPRQENHPRVEAFHAATAATVFTLPALAASAAVTPAAVTNLAAVNLPAAGTVADVVIMLMPDPISSRDADVSGVHPGSTATTDSNGDERPDHYAGYEAAEQPADDAIGVPAAAGADARTPKATTPAPAPEIGPVLEAVDALTCDAFGCLDAPAPAQLQQKMDGAGGVFTGDVGVGATAIVGQDVVTKLNCDGEAGQRGGNSTTVSNTRTNVLVVDRDDVSENGEPTMGPWEPPATLPAVDGLSAAAVEGTVASVQSTIAVEAGAVERVEEPHSGVFTRLLLRQSPQLVSLSAAPLIIVKPTPLDTGADRLVVTAGDVSCTAVLEAVTSGCDSAACAFSATNVVAAAAVMPDLNGNEQGTDVTAGPERADILEVPALGEAAATVAVAGADSSVSRPGTGVPPVSDSPSDCVPTSRIGASKEGSLELAALDSGSGWGGAPAAMSAEAQLEAAVMAALCGM